MLIRYAICIAIAATGTALLFREDVAAGIGLLLLAAILCLLPAASRKARVRLPFLIELGAAAFALMALFGKTLAFYDQVPYWNKLTHALAGVVLALIGYALIRVYSRRDAALPPLLFSVFAVAFSVSLTTTWEIWEFAVDATRAGTRLQLGLSDTMWDLIAGSVGALAVGVIGYARRRNDDRKSWTSD